jgi:hypothetical protein
LICGSRYGWCIGQEGSTRERNDLLKRSFDVAAAEYPWINSLRDRSVTELEMRMALQRYKAKLPKQGGGGTASEGCWFYLRDPYYIEELDASLRRTYECEGPASAAKLRDLKDDINAAGLPVRQYHRPNQLADTLFEDIHAYIDKKYPQVLLLIDSLLACLLVCALRIQLQTNANHSSVFRSPWRVGNFLVATGA